MKPDDFTLRHLNAYIEFYVWVDEQDAFRAYAIEAITDDPELADLGWPSLYRSFQARN